MLISVISLSASAGGAGKAVGVKSMKFRALGVLVGVLALAAPAGAVDWIAIATRRKGSGDLCFGVGRSVFGKLVRHDIKNSRVAGSRTIYKGKARRACINWTGDKVAFLKLDGHLCVIGIDGKGFKELKKTRNHNGTAMDNLRDKSTEPGPRATGSTTARASRTPAANGPRSWTPPSGPGGSGSPISSTTSETSVA